MCPAASAAAEEEKPIFTTAGYRRPLHWVFKIGDLKKSMDFYENVFGMHIHRHEEFASGCEATCNGPYGGAWSKTMVGFGSEYTNYALELTYNYGIDSYEKGNDLRYLAIKESALKNDPASLGYPVSEVNGDRLVTAPDGYQYLVVSSDKVGNFGQEFEPFLFTSIHVKDLAASMKFYTEVLGGEAFEDVPGATVGSKSIMIGYEKGNAQQIMVELVELPPNEDLDFKMAAGRFATETEDGAEYSIAERVQQAKQGTILHGPIKLQPHGEEVVIVQDLDGHEYCFVDARGYENCINVAYAADGKTVDYEYRKKINEAALKGGEEAKKEITRLMAGAYDANKLQAKIQSIVTGSPVVVFSQTTCPFCEKAKALLESAGAKYQVIEVDSLGQEGYQIRCELEMLTGRSSVPNIFIGGNSVGGFSDGPGVETLEKEGTLAGKLADAGAV